MPKPRPSAQRTTISSTTAHRVRDRSIRFELSAVARCPASDCQAASMDGRSSNQNSMTASHGGSRCPSGSTKFWTYPRHPGWPWPAAHGSRGSSAGTCVWRIADLRRKSVIRHTQVGGFAVILGAFVAIVSLPMAAVLLVAMFTVHLPYGFSAIKLIGVTAAGAQFGPPGYEVNLLYIACLAALVLGGSGPFAVDRFIGDAISNHLRLRPSKFVALRDDHDLGECRSRIAEDQIRARKSQDGRAEFELRHGPAEACAGVIHERLRSGKR
jgi:uncharacterized membrane protein YphA (DoxX/SURF4 family)